MTSIDGLVSGMQTSSIISQLMQLERQPVTRLELRKSTADKAITALQGLNTKFLAIADLAKQLSTATGFSPMLATVSKPEAVSVSVAEGTAPTSLSFKVKSIVSTHQVYSATTYAAPTTQVASVGRTITIGYTAADGTAATLDVANHDGTLQSIADAINGTAASPISARVVKTTDAGDYRLEFTSKTAGADGVFTVTGIRNPPTPEVAFNVATAGSDAEILVGSSGTPLSITSASNTFVDVLPGVSLTVKQADLATPITVDVARDTATLSGDVEKLITAANELLKEAKTLTGYDTAGKTAGILQGNPLIRQLSNDLLNAVSSAVGGQSAVTAGIELNRDGTLEFDKATFENAYTTDPTAVAAIFYGPVGSEGIAQRLIELSDKATKSTTGPDGRTYGGLLTQAIESRRNEIKRIDDSLAVWDVRLTRKEAALRRQFAALEAALGSAQTQGNWLASQIAQLPTAMS